MLECELWNSLFAIRYSLFAIHHSTIFAPMKLIGITGGIGTGKSTVVDILRKRGWKVVASDATAKEIMSSDADVRRELKEAFGEEVLAEQGVNAKVLAGLVFGSSVEHHHRLTVLNKIVHPRVLDAHLATIEAEREKGTSLLAIESALLFEVELEEGFDWVVVVDAPTEVCIERVIKRSGASAEEVQRRMNEQMSMEEKRGLADFVIDNGGSHEDLEGAVGLVAMILETFPDPDSEEAPSED